MVNPQLHPGIGRSIIPENIMNLSLTVCEKTAGQNDLKKENRPYLPTGSEFLTNENKLPEVLM
jgi:hypothetical protein